MPAESALACDGNGARGPGAESVILATVDARNDQIREVVHQQGGQSDACDGGGRSVHRPGSATCHLGMLHNLDLAPSNQSMARNALLLRRRDHGHPVGGIGSNHCGDRLDTRRVDAVVVGDEDMDRLASECRRRYEAQGQSQADQRNVVLSSGLQLPREFSIRMWARSLEATAEARCSMLQIGESFRQFNTSPDERSKNFPADHADNITASLHLRYLRYLRANWVGGRPL